MSHQAGEYYKDVTANGWETVVSITAYCFFFFFFYWSKVEGEEIKNYQIIKKEAPESTLSSLHLSQQAGR